MALGYVVLITIISTSLAAREEDRVEYLPGLPEDDQPTFNHYAGYLNASGGSKLFYWFVESENNPADDPVVLWLNGGPGCSSLTGFLVELGPWRVTPDGSGLTWFEHRWNKIANIIFLESPACVGYSYNEFDNCTSSDDQTAFDNHEALIDFFNGFPEFAENDFYVTGESYAGIYVPTLSARLVNDARFNFKGFAVGNAVTNYDTMDNALVPYEWARGFLSTELWEDLVSTCCPDNNATSCHFAESNNPQCNFLMLQVFNVQWAIGLNPYNYLQECFGGALNENGLLSSNQNGKVTMMHPDPALFHGKMYYEYLQFYKEMSLSNDVYSSIPCTDTSDRETYLNNPEVREALHVPGFVPQWEACSNNVSQNYDRQYSDVSDEYFKVLDAGHRVLVFNGDLDMACNHLGDMWFVEDLDQPLLDAYKPWTYTSEFSNSTQIGGWVSQYENLVFNQVLGAGHFVPTDKPYPAYVMWEKYIYDDPY